MHPQAVCGENTRVVACMGDGKLVVGDGPLEAVNNDGSPLFLGTLGSTFLLSERLEDRAAG